MWSQVFLHILNFYIGFQLLHVKALDFHFIFSVINHCQYQRSTCHLSGILSTLLHVAERYESEEQNPCRVKLDSLNTLLLQVYEI